MNKYITKSACEWLRSHRERMTLKRKKDAKTEPWGVRHERDRERQPKMVRKWRCGAQAMCQACVLGHVQLSATPWTVARQAPLSMEFPRQEYWRGLPFPPPAILPSPGIKPESPVSPALQADSLPAEPSGKQCFSKVLQKHPWRTLQHRSWDPSTSRPTPPTHTQGF